MLFCALITFYWVDQEFHLVFSKKYCGKTQTNFFANPIVSDLSSQNDTVFLFHLENSCLSFLYDGGRCLFC